MNSHIINVYLFTALWMISPSILAFLLKDKRKWYILAANICLGWNGIAIFILLVWALIDNTLEENR